MTSDTIVHGWLTIGSLAASTGQQGIGWNNGLLRWREQNPGHPAMSILGDIEIPEHLLLQYPRQIALLLPLSGSAATAGLAVQNGFLGAFRGGRRKGSYNCEQDQCRLYQPPDIHQQDLPVEIPATKWRLKRHPFEKDQNGLPAGHKAMVRLTRAAYGTAYGAFNEAVCAG